MDIQKVKCVSQNPMHGSAKTQIPVPWTHICLPAAQTLDSNLYLGRLNQEGERAIQSVGIFHFYPPSIEYLGLNL